MSDTKVLKKEYTGSTNKVVHCEGALESFHEAAKSVTASKKKSLIRQMIMQIERLARGERMSSGNFAPESTLPKASKGKKFYALKKIPIRGYCWQSSKNPKNYYISHYISKDFQKLRQKDIDIVHGNWTRIEVDGDEC